MNILVVGANGQLGMEMRLVARDSTHNYLFTDVNNVEGVDTTYLDITDKDSVRKFVVDNDVETIVNCAAWTNVDACETDEKLGLLAEKLNATAPGILAEVLKEVGGLLIHISTDYVFGKEPYNIPCKPEHKGTPTGVYGMTKLHGEQKIQESGCRFVIIRTAWLYSEFGKNFLKTMLSLTESKPLLKVVFDQCGTPTYALDLAKAIVAILDNFDDSKCGIYHFSNEGVCSWYDFTKMIQRISESVEPGKRNACSIQPCYSHEYPSPVIRPSYSVLDKSKIKETFKISIPYWVDSLENCIKNLLVK